MAKFSSKKDMLNSLKNGLNLVGNPLEKDTWYWAMYEELPQAYENGFVLINDEKREYYEKSG